MKDMDSLHVLWNTIFCGSHSPSHRELLASFVTCVCCSSASHLSPSCALVRPHLQQLFLKLQLNCCPTTCAFQYVFPHEYPGTVGVFLLPAARWDTFVDRLTRAARPCSKDKLCAEEKALGELDKPSQDPGATSDLSAFHSNARCALLIWLQEQGGTE